jgi:hypothetical protein
VILFTTALSAKPQLVKRITPGPRGTVILFVASMCPCMDAHRAMIRTLTEELQGQGINFVCVFSNAGETRDLAENMFRQIGWDMPYILDSRGTLAEKYGATNTPQAIVLDQFQQMVFRGPIDDSSKNLGRITQPYLKNALADLMAGQSVQVAEVAPTGCWIVSR